MVTQKDIATKLGISVALVSRALAGKSAEIGASPATVERILRAAEEMGYVPNATARMLRGAPTRTLGVVVYDFEDPFLGVLVNELQNHARNQDYSLVLSGFQRRQVSVQDVRGLVKHRIDGLIIVGSSPESHWLAPFLGRGIPIACIGSGPAIPKVHRVTHDAAAGMRMLMEHLSGLGHRKLGFIHSRSTNQRARHTLFLKTIPDFALESRPEWQQSSEAYITEAGYEATCRMIAGSGAHLPSAVLAANDLAALGALRAFAERGMRVPGDISLTGYDDIPYAHLTAPALTTIRQPIKAMVGEAFTWATRTASDLLPAPPREILPELVVRESTAAAS